ncbi:MAG: Zn-dependent protease with chaperone function [Marmoricola sp.]|nr:Zn-dependent protease with chaperone function [Marmoricola sp.]
MNHDARPDPRVGLTVVVLAGGAFVLLAALLVPWQWLPGQHVHAVPAASVFTEDQIAQHERISWMFRRIGWASLAVGLVVALVLGLTRAGGRLVARVPGPWAVKVVLGSGAISLVGTVAVLPLAARSQQIDRDNGLSLQGWGSWLSDQGIAFAVAWVFTAVGVLALMVVARKAPRTWPAWAATGAAALAMLGSFVYPVVVEPLFNNFTSMPAGPLRTEIFALAKAEHVHVDDVLVADASRRTTTLNAYVSGFGSTRRVVVYDTVLSSLSDPEVEAIVAHELGHAKHGDVLIGTALGALGSAFGIGLLGLLLADRRLLRRAGADGVGDPRAVPLLLALVAVGALLASPVQNTISRAIEARADRTALETTGDSATFIAMQRELSLRSLSDPTPPRLSQFWFGSHPTVLQRVGMAEQMAPTESRR